MAAPPPPPPNRYITTTDPETGKSTLLSAIPPEVAITLSTPSQLARLAYSAPAVPIPFATNSEADIHAYGARLNSSESTTDGQRSTPVTPGAGGTSVWCGDTAPGCSGPLHGTGSLDFVVVVQGEMELVLEDGTRQVLRQGDLCVQRDTMHQWRNPSLTTWARVVGVVVDNRAGGDELRGEEVS